MATAAHCIACFEALDAHLHKRKPLSLDEIQSKWDAYVASSSSGSSRAKSSSSSAPKGALGRLAALAGGTSQSSLSSNSSSTVASAAAVSTPATSLSSLPLASYPLFVTWNTYDDDDVDEDDPDDDEVTLRGCIGTFENQDLHTAVPEYALISALNDHRFPPIAKAELPTLQTAVTLLTDFEAVDDPYDWEIGTHGVRLSFQDDRGRRYGSTYLPDVIAEQGWTREEALFSLTRKAGWMGGQSKFKDLDLHVTRYQGAKAKLGYAGYKKWRTWVEKNN